MLGMLRRNLMGSTQLKEKNCMNCGKNFSVPPARDFYSKNFCSAFCREKYFIRDELD